MNRQGSGLFFIICTLSIVFSTSVFSTRSQSEPVAVQDAKHSSVDCPLGFAEGDSITIWSEDDQQWYQGQIKRCLNERGTQQLIITYTAEDGHRYEMETTVERGSLN